LRPSGFDGPGDYRWFCLDHIRAFNAGYDYFEGMSAEEIWQAQSPIHGWASEQRAFRPTAGVDDAPRWADYADPLEAIAARAEAFQGASGSGQSGAACRWSSCHAGGTPRAGALELGIDADRRQLRSRYSDLVHRYHPDRNGGDRSHEAKLQQVVEAYQLLRKAAAFS
jgi:hypothetical protein